MHPKLEEILRALRTPQTPEQKLHDVRYAVADILSNTDYRRLYDFTTSLRYHLNVQPDVEFSVAFAPTRQQRDGMVTQVGNLHIRIKDRTTGVLLDSYKAVPLSQD